MSSLCLQICKKCVRKCLQNNGVTGYLNCMLLFCCKVLVLILPFTHNPVKRGESTIAQGKPRSGAALGMEKKANGARRSGAEEADSRIAPSIVRKSLALTQIKRAPVPARSVASLRSSPLSVGLRCVACAPSLRAQFHFFTLPKVTLLTQLHLGLLHFRPAWRGFELRSPTARKHPFNFRFIA